MHNAAGEMSAYNACVRYTVNNVVTGTYPDYEIDYSKFRISTGNLGGACGCLVVYSGDRTKPIDFTWINELSENTDSSDRVLICVVNATRNEAVVDVSATRGAGASKVSIPSRWEVGEILHVYIGFSSEKDASVSESLGSVTV